MVSKKLQIRSVILDEFRRGSTARETTQKICETFGPGALVAWTCYRWYAKFRGDFNLDDEPRAGRPRAVTVGLYSIW